MLSRTIAILTFALVIQGFNGETTEDVVSEYQPKIEALRNDVESATNNSRGEVDQTRGVINDKINASFNEVRSKINALREAAKEAEENAQAAGIDIEECVVALNASLKNLSLGPLALCYANQDLILAQTGLKSLTNLQKNTTNIIGDCLEIYPSDDQVSDLRKCLDSKIVRITVQVKVIQTGIKLALNRAAQSADDCSSKAVAQINTSIEAIANNFDDCIKAS